MLGGGGLIAVNSYAAAGEGWGLRSDGRNEQTQTLGAGPSTIKCPEVANGLPEVPDAARPEVDRELATLDSQITEAYEGFVDQKEQIERDPQFARDAVLEPLKSKRTASIDRIATALGRVAGQRPQGLEAMAPCTLQVDDADGAGGGEGNGQDQGDGQNTGDGGQDNGNGDGGGDQGSGGQAGNGPEASDFVDIASVQPNVRTPRELGDASRGTFATDCGRNENGKFNPDNVIVAPGVSNGAHHMHDYVGNQANDAFASDDDLAGGATTCRDQGDRSTYYWPVLRLQNGQDENDAQADGGGKDKNVGTILTPAQVTLNFVGSPVSKVTAMPRFLRIITGDAKAFVNGNANANASWSCTGFEDRQLKDKYPLCPQGSKVVRSFKFQSCWDGQNTDSANHRTHVAFADENGRCQNGFRAIPQLMQRIVYDVPPPVFDGNNRAAFAVDSFPEQLHKPVTDHGDFINVFDDSLMRDLVDCINEGRECGPDGPAKPGEPGEPSEPGNPGAPEDPAEPTKPGNSADPGDPAEPGETENPADPGRPAEPSDPVEPGKPADPSAGDGGIPTTGGPDAGNTGGQAQPDATGDVQEPEGTTGAGAGTTGGQAKPDTAGGAQQPGVLTGSGKGTSGTQATPDTGGSTPAPGTGGESQTGNGTQAGSETQAGGEPQGDRGGLAATGAQLWPSVAGAVLLIVGIVLLRTRNRREPARH
ncbi:DUF1996 domain-containing protein [Streptomyces sp. ISL-1]|uniref:DUF1996 domain-containing protein n=1 Tax=Streptomyces sp. ISL-1 TaxID=2817657 RepID=UPI001BE8FF82|nr:DUF1996 domain-containing protein [Streptomyces sp. ISL-1]MBT2392122.1 DUF1996 domain-containing protein [Streptomyces sp. ISL-1]